MRFAVSAPTPTPPPPPPSGLQLYLSPTGVDSASCVLAAPCHSLARADTIAVPGTTVNVAPGTYTAARLAKSGTSTARIRYVSTSKWGARLAPGTTMLGQYIDVVNFEVTGPFAPGFGYFGLRAEGNYTRAIGNFVHDIYIVDSSNGGAGILASNNAYTTHDQQITGNRVEDIGDGIPDNRVQGIYWSVPNVTIANNVVARADAYGFHAWHAATGGIIANNTSVSNGRSGFIIGQGDSGSTAAGYTNGYIINNISAFNAHWGYREYGNASGNHFINNLQWGNSDAASPFLSLDVTGTITADPRFVSGATDDYRLLTGSPAIDSGTLSRAPTTDFLDTFRPLGAGVDRGAYER